MKLKMVEKRQETKDVFSFVFEPEEPVLWDAGQYMFYKILHDKQDSRGDTRIFTISSAPYQKKIMLTTRYLFEESSSFKKALFTKEIGESIEGLRISGYFTVQQADDKMVFIAGGIGITPFHSILLELENKKSIKDIILIYSNKREEDVIFKDTLDRLNQQHSGLKIFYIFSPQRCDQKMMKEVVPEIENRTYYLSGPTRLIKAVEEDLVLLNVPKERIKKDYFPGTEES